MKFSGSFVLAAATSAILVGCGGSDGGSGSEEANAVAKVYASNGYEVYGDAVTTAQALKTAVDAFVAAPSEATLTAAKTAWKASREPYLHSEPYRFFDGPIDNATDGPEPYLNSWPLDENFIDYVVDNENTGIINLTTAFPAITIEVLKGENTLGGEANISTGYHAVEFLLWGQDLSPTGPGARPFTDYVTTGGGTHANQGRRAQYLQLVTDLIVTELTQVHDAWAPGTEYRTEIESGGMDTIEKILRGMGSLSGAELSGERMQVAYDDRDQEDEHSCFSDNTHRDLIGDAAALQNVYLGVYGATDNDGVGLYDLVKAKDATLADKLKTEIADTVTKMSMIPVPFDQAINDDANGRPKILAAIDALHTQTDTTVDVATALGIRLNLK
ncbi:imelysin family protein [soil metagenome]